MSGSPDDAQTLRDRIATLMPAWSVAEISSFSYLTGGYSNRNYRFSYDDGDYVLRVPGASANVDRTGEQHFYERSAQAGPAAVATPEVIAYNLQTGAMISRWQAGRLLVDAGADASELVTYLQTLHGSLPATASVYDPLALARRQLAAGDVPKQIWQVLAGCRYQPTQQISCHNDLNPWNVIVSPAGVWVTLDWEWFGSNDPLFDLVTLHQGLALENALLPDAQSLPALADQLLGSPCGADRLRSCVTVFWLREYAWAHAQLQAGNTRPEIHQQLVTSAGRLATL